QKPEAVMLDLVEPLRSFGRLVGLRRQAGFDEAGRCDAVTDQSLESARLVLRVRMIAPVGRLSGALGYFGHAQDTRYRPRAGRERVADSIILAGLVARPPPPDSPAAFLRACAGHPARQHTGCASLRLADGRVVEQSAVSEIIEHGPRAGRLF